MVRNMAFAECHRNARVFPVFSPSDQPCPTTLVVSAGRVSRFVTRLVAVSHHGSFSRTSGTQAGQRIEYGIERVPVS